MFGVLIHEKPFLSASNYLSKGKSAVQKKGSGILASDDLKTYNKVKGLVSGSQQTGEPQQSTGSALVQLFP